MPQIIVTADRPGDREQAAVMLRERVNAADFESNHFATQLVERLGWAVGDAHEAERAQRPASEPDSGPTDAATALSAVAREHAAATPERPTGPATPARQGS